MTPFKTGYGLTPARSTDDRAYDVVIQSNGKIVVSGMSQIMGTTLCFALARYNPNGSLDTNFTGPTSIEERVNAALVPEPGKVYTYFNPVSAANAITLQADGKILAGGYAFDSAAGRAGSALVRYNSNGSIDKTFGAGGAAITQIDGGIGAANAAALQAVALQKDGKIVSTGLQYETSTGNRYAFLTRHNPNGSLDTTFNGTGKVTNPDHRFANSIAIQSDGKIVIAGGEQVRWLQVSRYVP